MEVFYHVKHTDTAQKLSELKSLMKANNENIGESESEFGSGSYSDTSSISLSSECKFNLRG